MRQLWRRSWELQHVSSGPVKAKLFLIWKNGKVTFCSFTLAHMPSILSAELAAGESRRIEWLDTIMHLRREETCSRLWVQFLFHDKKRLKPADCEKSMQTDVKSKCFTTWHSGEIGNSPSFVCSHSAKQHLQKTLSSKLENQHMMSSGSGWGRGITFYVRNSWVRPAAVIYSRDVQSLSHGSRK